MATVTTGLLSPNTYGLNPDQVSSDSVSDPYNHYRPSAAAAQLFADSTQNTSDSDQDTYPAPQRHDAAPKRNKRKNFKPRCAPAAYEPPPPPQYLQHNNNNNHADVVIKNAQHIRRRKTLSTRKLLPDAMVVAGGGGSSRPMDLSKAPPPDSESSDSSSEDAYPSHSDREADGGAGSSDGDGGGGGMVIPSSFSIRNLAKPHAVAGDHHNHHQNHHHHQHQHEMTMREYAVNTMRELLGIYGLTSEVAESISRQLPIASFGHGKMFETLCLNASKQDSPLSQPPTPPSTPLSPRSVEARYATGVSHPGASSGQKAPLNLGRKSSSTGGGSPFTNGQSVGLNLTTSQHGGDYSYGGDRDDDSGGERSAHDAVRNFFQGVLPFSQLKTESSSPPPLDQNPLNAMMAQSLAPTSNRDQHVSSGGLLLNKSTTQLDYSKYVKKFTSSLECGSSYCKDLNYREHFHCLDCDSRVFIKKEEMIRHFKWHKKRDESLQHGFLRYSPLDDCGDRFQSCSHNRKQTHYHCIKENCDKVYISTSDVQMHANYHRKDSAIIQEGFQRYRATEECGATYCAFYGQRTTHFHCRRHGCRYTFKNKSDMEKHKTYHIKDEQLSKDGFKKFMKNEACPFDNCRFSKVCNHIHCIRPQCSYVLHSSGQLFSHKRKHERKDSELAYRKYKLAQSMMKTMQDGGSSSGISQQPFSSRDFEQMESLNLSLFGQNSLSNMSTTLSESMSERTSPVSYDEESTSAMDLTGTLTDGGQDEPMSWTSDDFWKKYCNCYGERDQCVEKCDLAFTEHYHCLMENCDLVFNSKESVREHARNHEQQELITENYFTTVTLQNGQACDDSCVYKDKHYHCNWENCREVIIPTDKPFRRLEHYKMHEYSRKLSLTKDPLTMTHLATSIDGMFCRKRGRPPKNRVIEVWNDYAPMGQTMMDSPQAIFTSFKLPKPSTTSSSNKETEQDDNDDRSSPQSPQQAPDHNPSGYTAHPSNSPCPEPLCPYRGASHYHCARCAQVSDREDALLVHVRRHHQHHHHRHPLDEGDDNQTEQRRASRDEDEAEEKGERDEEKMSGGQQGDLKVSVVKASGTFYPLSTLPTTERNKSPDISKSIADSLNNGSSSDVMSAVSGSNTLYGPDISCSRPFCKLKRKYHYHCNACNQAFSELDRLVVHVAKHSTSALQSQLQEDQSPPTKQDPPKITLAPIQALQNPQPAKMENEPPSIVSSASYLATPFDAYNAHYAGYNLATQFALLSQQQQQGAFLPQMYQATAGGIPAQLMFQPSLAPHHLLGGGSQQGSGPFAGAVAPGGSEGLTGPLAAMAAGLTKRALSPHHELSPDQKKARIQNSMRILKDEPVPEGYLRFRFNEDCQYQHCGYREHQTHFHCQRQDCGYSFCDKTRFVQHTARHERLDTLMGGDFQQYRANVACGRPDCAYTANLGSTQNKASHFHCLKCEFVCTDTNKVVAHRRQHQKLDSIQAAGFEKFTPSQQCRSPACQHSGKQTHYHCLSCQYAVLGLAQMSAHKYRHMEG